MSEPLAIPEIPLAMQPESDAARAVVGFKWADAGIGTRSKLGGSPDWLQGDRTPSCSCGTPMSFYGQLDSIGDAICIADCGMIYVFVCFGCLHSQTVLQSA